MNNDGVLHNYKSRLIALFIGYAAWGVFWGAWGGIIPAVQIASHSSDAVLGTVLLFVAVGALPSMMLIGPIIDRFGPKALIASIISFAISVITLCFVNSPLLLSIALLIIGATSGALDVSLNSGVASLEAVTNKKFFNKATAAFPIAVVIASPLAGLAIEHNVSLPIIFIIISLVVFISALFNIFPHNNSWKIKKSTNKKTFFPKISITKVLLILGLTAAGIHIIEVAVEQWSAIYLENSLHASPSIASLGPAIYMGMLFVGRLVAQYYEKKLLDWQMLVITGISAALGMAIATMSVSPAIALFGYAVAGFGMASGIPTIFSITGRSVDDANRGKAVASVTTVGYFGYLISPPFVGILAGLFTLRFSWLILCLFALLSVFVFYFFRRLLR